MTLELYLKEHLLELYRDLLYRHKSLLPLSVSLLMDDDGAEFNVKIIAKKIQDNRVWTAILDAIREEYHCGIKELFEIGAAVNLQDKDGNTPLHKSVNDYKVVKVLLDKGASPHFMNLNKETPLHLAAKEGNVLVVKLLLSKGAVVSVKDESGQLPLHLAVVNGSSEIIKLLLEKGSDVNDGTIGTSRTSLHIAAQFNRSNILQLLLNQGADPNMTETFTAPCDNIKLGFTALHFAAANKSVYGCQLLLNFGADPNIRDDFGCSALFFAVQSNSYEIVKLLLNGGADVNIKENRGNSSLHEAVKVGNIQILKVLLERGAKIDMKNVNGKTPLHYAINIHRLHYGINMHSTEQLVELLTDWGAPMVLPTPNVVNGASLAEYAFGCDWIVPILQKCFYKLICIKLIQNKSSNLKNADSVKVSCLAELVRMKEIKHGTFSVFDVLTKYHDPYYVTNTMLHQAILDSEKQFPIYHLILFGTFFRAKERYKLLREVQENVNINFLPKEIEREILTYLSDDDLQNVLIAFQES